MYAMAGKDVVDAINLNCSYALKMHLDGYIIAWYTDAYIVCLMRLICNIITTQSRNAALDLLLRLNK